jgi:hypothetical protein
MAVAVVYAQTMLTLLSASMAMPWLYVALALMSTVEALSIENTPTAYLNAEIVKSDADAMVKDESFNLSADIDTALVPSIAADPKQIRSAFVVTALSPAINTTDSKRLPLISVDIGVADIESNPNITRPLRLQTQAFA